MCMDMLWVLYPFGHQFWLKRDVANATEGCGGFGIDAHVGFETLSLQGWDRYAMNSLGEYTMDSFWGMQG